MERNQHFALRSRHFSDIDPIDCGVEQCASGHTFGPHVRRYYLLHYVLAGKGTFFCREGTYSLSAGQFFLIRPDEVTTYAADIHDPWHYIWIGFTGEQAKQLEGLSSPVGDLPSATFRELLGMIQGDFPGWNNMQEEYIVTVIYRIMALMFAHLSPRRHYVSRVENVIRTSYMQDISVQYIADEMCVDRRHLSRQFKKRYGVSIQEYLISVRLENAAKLLSDGYSVTESCDLCGYKDRSNFSRMFYRRYGVWPSEYAHVKE